MTTTVDVNGHPCRVWSKGKGPKLGFLAGLGGLPRCLAIAMKQRLVSNRRQQNRVGKLQSKQRQRGASSLHVSQNARN